MNTKSDLTNFVAEDCDYFKRWDESAPFFDNFYILGPEDFNPNSQPACLFQYPITFQRLTHQNEEQSSLFDQNTELSPNNNISNYHNMNDKEFKSAIKQWEIIINTDGGKIAQFIFPDGIHYIEDDESYLSADFSLIDTFSKPPKIQDHIIFIKSDGSIPHYYFCLRFRCSPFSRPSAFSILRAVMSSKLHTDGQKNSNIQQGFYEEEVSFYFEKMKNEFECEMIKFRDMKKCPTSLFAFIFETQHPCHDLYFGLIELISRLEASKKTVSLNLHNLLRSSYLSEKSEADFAGCEIGKKRRSSNDDDDDDFIIVEKVDGIKSNGSIDCVISIKESKEIENESAGNEANAACIGADNKKETKNEISITKKDEDDGSSSIQSTAQTCYPDSVWPENAFKSRDEFLKSLYSGTSFPSIGTESTFKTGSSILSKFVWKRPTTQFSCARLCAYGIEPLFEWITLDDLIGILTLIFLEFDVIVAGTEVEPIVRVVSSLSHLIFPFAWMFPILTIVPDSFVDILGSPVPFIAGVFKSEKCVKKFFDLDDSENILIIDMDERNIKWPTQKHPKISCHELYYNELKKFCSTTKKVQCKTYENHQSKVLIIPNESKNKNKLDLKLNLQKVNQTFASKFKALSKIGAKKDFYFDSDKIGEVIDTIFNLNQTVFISKIYPSIVTGIENSENKSVPVGSMLVDEIYLSQFEDQKNNLPFVFDFMKTQMFVSFREQACKQRTDEETKIIGYA